MPPKVPLLSALLLAVFVLAVATPVWADVEESSTGEITAPLEGKALRKAIKALDRSDPAVAYARSLRTEGQLLIASGTVTMVSLIVGASIATRLADDEGAQARLAMSVGMPLSIGVLVAGVPGFLSGPRYLAWYVNHDRPPSELARLKLLNRWRRQYIQVRKNTGLVGSAFLGAATLVSAVGWAVNDKAGFNGALGSDGYRAGDALATLAFGMVTGSFAAAGLISHLQLQNDAIDDHPALSDLRLNFGVAPDRSMAEVRGYRVQGSLSFQF